jgi:hypothetical protein
MWWFVVAAAAAALLWAFFWPFLTTRRRLRLRARGKFYFGAREALWAMWRNLAEGEGQRAAAEAAVLRVWPSKSAPGGPVVALSVRTAFDLWLQALALPAGSEVVLSGVTIKVMCFLAAYRSDVSRVARTWGRLCGTTGLCRCRWTWSCPP